MSRSPRWPLHVVLIALSSLALSALAGSWACSGTPSGAGGPGSPDPRRPGHSRADAEMRYDVFLMERRVGGMVVTERPDGARTVTYQYQDRGRGPKLRAEVAVDERGVPRRFAVRGTDYWSAPVDEEFSAADGTSRWRSSVDSGTRETAEPAFYVPLQSTAGDDELLVRALLADPDGTLPLLPSGEARIEKRGEATVTAGAESRRVTLYAIHGVGLEPSYLWLDADRRLFAVTGGWQRTVRAGWDSALPELWAIHRADQLERLRESARELPVRPDGEVAFRDVAVFDPRSGEVRTGMTVVIAGDRVKRIGEGAAVAVSPSARVIDGRGHTLVPGLWDMHVHIGVSDGVLHLAAGVTTVRDLANDIDEARSIAAQWDSGEVLGPRTILAGFMDGTSEYTGPTKVIVDSAEQAEAAVARYADLGYPQIKVYSSIKPELVPTIVAAAHSRGLRVSGHIPAFMTAEQAVEQGFDEIQHGNFLILNFLFDRVQDTRTPARFTAVGEHGAGLDLDSPEVARFVELLRDRGVAVDPTVAIFEQLLTARKGEVSPGYRAIANRLPVLLRRGLSSGGLPVSGELDARYRQSFAKMLELVARLHRAGVQVVAGTDSIAGFTLHRELELYVQAGIPAAEVLSLATLGSAELMKRDGDLGSIEPGKLADMILVAGNPAERISDIRRTALTVKGGVLYPAAALYRSLGISHDVPSPLAGR